MQPEPAYEPPSGDPDESGARLAAEEGRLRLLVVHLAGRAVRARVPAEDLVQEVFLRAVTAPGGLPPREPGEQALRRFLARLARNAVVDAARAIRAARRDGRTEPLARSDWSRAGTSRLADRAPGPSTHAQGRELAEALASAFEGLSPEHRRVLGLRQLEGLSAAEAARRMGRSETAVHSLYRRALAAWQGALEGTR